jgi:hypothetical protein
MPGDISCGESSELCIGCAQIKRLEVESAELRRATTDRDGRLRAGLCD